MTRGLSGSFETALDEGEVYPIILVNMDTESGPVRVWSGVGDLTFQSNVYQGTGTLGGVSAVEETTRMQALGAKLTLSGVPNSLIATALSDMRQSRLCTIYFGLFDAGTKTIVSDPTEIFVGFTDQVEISEDGANSTISVNVEHKLIRFKTEIKRFFTPEDQAAVDSSDLGFEYVAGLVDGDFTWR